MSGAGLPARPDARHGWPVKQHPAANRLPPSTLSLATRVSRRHSAYAWTLPCSVCCVAPSPVSRCGCSRQRRPPGLDWTGNQCCSAKTAESTIPSRPMDFPCCSRVQRWPCRVARRQTLERSALSLRKTEDCTPPRGGRSSEPGEPCHFPRRFRTPHSLGVTPKTMLRLAANSPALASFIGEKSTVSRSRAA